MNDTFPDDADGAALRRVAALGADMSAPITIDFFVAAPNYDAANAIAREATLSGYRTEVVHDEEDDAWDCYCTKTIVPTYEGVVEAQIELKALSKPFGGISDGWGTEG